MVLIKEKDRKANENVSMEARMDGRERNWPRFRSIKHREIVPSSRASAVKKGREQKVPNWSVS